MNFQKHAHFALAIIFTACAAAPKLHAQAPPAPPVTASDAKEFNEARVLFEAQKWKEARSALERFVEKYKTFSPRSRDAKLMLAVVSIQSKAYEEGIKQLRDLIADKNVGLDGKAMAQLSIAKAMTMLAFERFPVTDTDAQKAARKKALENALAEYDAFIASFPQSKDGDSANFLKGQVLVGMESYDLAVPAFGVVLQKYPNSPLKWDSQMWIGKAQFIQGATLLKAKAGKDAGPEEVRRGLAAFDLAESALVATYQGSGDVALQNDATFFIGQMQLMRSQHVAIKDEEKAKARQMELMNAGLQAFRSVRSVEEVVGAQEEKIKRLEQALTMIVPGTPEYMPMKNRIENLIGIETEKIEGYKKGQDQYLAARLAIARIFLFLKKNDECRVLLRALQMQKEVFEKDKDAAANVASMLCLTYADQKNADKALETYEAFRAAYKGNEIGDNLALIVANALVDKDKPEKAEEIINQGLEDYKDWRFAPESLRILCAVALKKGDYAKASELVEKVLTTTTLTNDVEAETLFLKATILQKKGKEEGVAADVDNALITFQKVRDKFPTHPKAEDSWFAMAQIHSEKEPAKGKVELEQFIAKFGDGSGKSESTKANIPVAQYLLARCLTLLGEKDPKLKEDAIKAYRVLLEKWPESEAAPGVLFKIFEIYNEKPDYQMCMKLMEEFVAKYPTHENVYYAYGNMAELLFAGSLNTKTDASGKTVPAGKASFQDLEAGSLKLYSYVDYEMSKDLKVKRGDSALLKIADRWLDELRKMPPFMALTPEQKLTWQKTVDNVIAAIERQLKNYPKGSRLGEGLERLVKLQIARVKAQQTDAAQVEAYFKDLAVKFGTDPIVKGRIQAKLSEFLLEADPKRSYDVIEDAIRNVPEAVKDKDGNVAPTFSPLDYDRYISGLFDAKKHGEVAKIMKRLNAEHPDDSKSIPANVLAEARAVALYWEGKELQEQGNNAAAGAKFSELAEKYPKSAKKMEADYGVILGDLERGTLKEEAALREGLQRLADIVKMSNTKTFDLQAKALFLMGRLYEELKDYDSAVGAYLKISSRFQSVPRIAGDGLWKGAQILEKQANGEIKVLTPLERKAANDKAAAAIKAAADKVKAETEKTKPADAKDPKAPADKNAKPGAAKDPKAPAGKDAKAGAAKDPKAAADKDAKPAAKPDAADADKPGDKPGDKESAKPAEVQK